MWARATFPMKLRRTVAAGKAFFAHFIRCFLFQFLKMMTWPQRGGLGISEALWCAKNAACAMTGEASWFAIHNLLILQLLTSSVTRFIHFCLAGNRVGACLLSCRLGRCFCLRQRSPLATRNLPIELCLLRSPSAEGLAFPKLYGVRKTPHAR